MNIKFFLLNYALLTAQVTQQQTRDDNVFISHVLRHIQKEAVMAYFKALHQHLLRAAVPDLS
jgi:hypothetical protein